MAFWMHILITQVLQKVMGCNDSGLLCEWNLRFGETATQMKTFLRRTGRLMFWFFRVNFVMPV